MKSNIIFCTENYKVLVIMYRVNAQLSFIREYVLRSPAILIFSVLDTNYYKKKAYFFKDL